MQWYSGVKQRWTWCFNSVLHLWITGAPVHCFDENHHCETESLMK